MIKKIIWEPLPPPNNSSDLLTWFTRYVAYQGWLNAQPEQVKDELEKRRELGNTLIDPQVAVPHIQSKEVTKSLMVYVYVSQPLTDWEKGEEVERFIFILLPFDCPQNDLLDFKNFFLKVADEKVMNILATGNQKAIGQLLKMKGG